MYKSCDEEEEEETKPEEEIKAEEKTGDPLKDFYLDIVNIEDEEEKRKLMLYVIYCFY